MSTAAAAGSSASETKDEAIPLSDVLQKLSSGLLTEFASGVNVKIRASASKKAMAETLINDAYAQGAQILLEQLDKTQLKTTMEALAGKQIETNDKGKLKKMINDKLKEQKTLDDFLDQLTPELLKEFCKALDFEEDTNDKGELINAVSDETIIVGMRHLLDMMTKDFVSDVATGVGVKVTGTKKDVINRILGLSYKHILEAKASGAGDAQDKDKRTDRTNLDIKKGVTSDELFQTYYATELKNYCREHGLLVTGARRDLCKRIAAYVNGDEVSTKKGQKKRKRAAGSSKSSKSSKKKRTQAASSEEGKKEEAAKDDKKEAAEKPAEKKDAEKKEAEKKETEKPVSEKKDTAAPATDEKKEALAETTSGKLSARRTKK